MTKSNLCFIQAAKLTDIDYRGNDIKHQSGVETQHACAVLAASTAGGLFWTWREGSGWWGVNGCFVKNSDSGRSHYSGAVSGNKQCGRSRNLILVFHI